MTWHAKPKGAYKVGSDEWNDNITEIYYQLKSNWTVEAIAGMCGNMQAESGLNPWRWQSDSVSLTSDKKGYGLPQFTPAYGYINNYGKGKSGYAPNLSVSEVTTGANASDGHAQIIVIDTDAAHKFLNRVSRCKYADLKGTYPFSKYKQVTDLYLASTGWLFNYEYPADRSESVAQARYGYAQMVYEFLAGESPPEPPPEPPTPDPPYPQPVTKEGRNLKWYMCPWWKQRIY